MKIPKEITNKLFLSREHFKYEKYNKRYMILTPLSVNKKPFKFGSRLVYDSQSEKVYVVPGAASKQNIVKNIEAGKLTPYI